MELNALGIGGSISLLFVAPIVLLFSYTRKHQNKGFDRLVPIIGIVLIFFTYLESIRAIILRLPELVANGLSML